MCVDTPTGYKCTCFTGYQLASDMVNCTGTILRPRHLFSALLLCLQPVSNMPCPNIRPFYTIHNICLDVARDSIPLSLLLTDYSIV